MRVVDVSDTEAAKVVEESIHREKPGMAINTTKVDEKEVKRIMGLVESSFKRTPPKLQPYEYDAMNTVISVCNFDHCLNDLDSIRTFYEALFPTLKQLYGEVEGLSRELVRMRSEVLPIVETMIAKNRWQSGDNEKNFKRVAELIHMFVPEIPKKEDVNDI